jgi:hypothetical protein
VFTARYALSPYIKHIRFAFKGLNLVYMHGQPIFLFSKPQYLSWALFSTLFRGCRELFPRRVKLTTASLVPRLRMNGVITSLPPVPSWRTQEDHYLYLKILSAERYSLDNETNFKYKLTKYSWLRHCATNRQVAGSIPDGVSGFFSLA